jgi:hypothetical protein
VKCTNVNGQVVGNGFCWIAAFVEISLGMVKILFCLIRQQSSVMEEVGWYFVA